MEIIKLIMLNFTDKCKRFYFKIQVSQQKMRVEKILKTTQTFLSARDHQELYVQLRENLPTTFGFEQAGVLFFEDITNSLYWIYGRDLRKLSLKSENIIRLPYNIGLTGEAIRLKRSLVFPKGEQSSGFLTEIDNIYDIQGIRNLLICPFFDDSQKIRGVLQLINKNGGERITDQDITEVSCICPSLSQVLRLCDTARDFQNVSTGLHQNMDQIRKEVQDKQDAFEYNLQMHEVGFQLNNL